jgi:hypothetical protein
VLEPLATRVSHRGRIYPDQTAPLFVLIELAETDPGRLDLAYRVLDERLREYPTVFTACRAGVVSPGPVTIVLTGATCPRHLLSAHPERYAFADGTFGDLAASAAPPALVPLVSEHWAGRFGWDGREELSGEERYLLHGLVRAAHADGRLVRVFGIPERPRHLRRRFWRELVAARVDLIGSRDLGALRRFLRRAPVGPEAHRNGRPPGRAERVAGS